MSLSLLSLAVTWKDMSYSMHKFILFLVRDSLIMVLHVLVAAHGLFDAALICLYARIIYSTRTNLLSRARTSITHHQTQSC